GGGRHGPGGSNALPLGSVRKECRGLANAAVRLDAPALDARLEAAITEHGLLVAWDEVIMPALRAVGRKWASSGERYVEVEHLLSWHISSVLRRVAVNSPVNTDRPPVLLACVPNEMHSLPLEALAAGLAQRGLPVRMFGAAVPAEALDEAVRRTGPAAVVLWSQSRGTADGTRARQIQATAWGVRGAR
ncbi:B12-binding domain-containing protein, partial [Streptomyces sparsus]